jgi:hypothetical protein
MPSKEASRRNSLKSTGPKTRAGKKKIRLNALWHGAFAKEALLPGEDPALFAEVQRDFRRFYKPTDPEEEFLVSRIIYAAWRLQRLAGMEPRILAAHNETITGDVAFQRLAWALTKPSFATSAPQSEPQPEPKSKKPDAPCDWVAKAWLRDAVDHNAIMKLLRYQNSLERSFYRAVRALRDLRESKP